MSWYFKWVWVYVAVIRFLLTRPPPYPSLPHWFLSSFRFPLPVVQLLMFILMPPQSRGNGVYVVARVGFDWSAGLIGFWCRWSGVTGTAGDQHVSHVNPPPSYLLHTPPPFNWENMESVLGVKILEHCQPCPPSPPLPRKMLRRHFGVKSGTKHWFHPPAS